MPEPRPSALEAARKWADDNYVARGEYLLIGLASLLERREREAVEAATPGIARAARVEALQWARSRMVLGADGGQIEAEITKLESHGQTLP